MLRSAGHHPAENLAGLPANARCPKEGSALTCPSEHWPQFSFPARVQPPHIFHQVQLIKPGNSYHRFLNHTQSTLFCFVFCISFAFENMNPGAFTKKIPFCVCCFACSYLVFFFRHSWLTETTVRFAKSFICISCSEPQSLAWQCRSLSAPHGPNVMTKAAW